MATSEASIPTTGKPESPKPEEAEESDLKYSFI